MPNRLVWAAILAGGIAATSACADPLHPADARRDVAPAPVTGRGADAAPRERAAKMAPTDDRGCALDAKGTPSVVIELFTSEGCSSCPSADENLRHVSEEARARGASLYALEFHVDYWNDLGWPDPFSAPSFTARQRAYTSALGTSGMYTPQMVVGGKETFVGSDAARTRRAVETALACASPARLELRAERVAGRQIPVSYAVDGPNASMVLNLALVEGGIVSVVTRGENAGRTLKHEGVVRSFVTTPIAHSAEGKLVVPAPEAAPGSHGRAIVGYVADRDSMRVLAASRIEL